ncbi:MAG: ankyrin repeat domain-containing protein [bacterium]|nr:ankyrin repeat domain-containing protein [bacterium]
MISLKKVLGSLVVLGLVISGCGKFKESDVDPRYEVGLQTLRKSVINGDRESVLTLIKRGVDINEKDSSGWTLLHYVAKEGHTKVAQILIDKGADANAKGNNCVSVQVSAVSYQF